MIQGSRRRFRLICSANGYARQRIAEGVGIAGADDLPAVGELYLGKTIRPGQHVGVLQGVDCPMNGIPAASGLRGYGFIAGEALPGAGVVKAPQEGLQNVEKRPGDGSVGLTGAFVLGIVSARIGHDSRLGVAVERNSGTDAEQLLSFLHESLLTVANSNRRDIRGP